MRIGGWQHELNNWRDELYRQADIRGDGTPADEEKLFEIKERHWWAEDNLLHLVRIIRALNDNNFAADPLAGFTPGHLRAHLKALVAGADTAGWIHRVVQEESGELDDHLRAEIARIRLEVGC